MKKNLERNKLVILRERANVDAKYVYKNININNETYSRWETGDRKVNLKGIIDISNLYNIKIDYLLDLSNSIMPTNKKYLSDKNIIGNRLKNIRINKSLSLRKENEITGVSFNAISRYERGIRLITVDALRKICDKLEIDADELLKESESSDKEL